MSDEVQVYAVGLVSASVCAPVETPRDEVEAVVNFAHPTGISSRWAIADEPFKGGEPNPCPCNDDETRQHWLLHC